MDTKELHNIIDKAIERAELTHRGAYQAVYQQNRENGMIWDNADRKAAFESVVPFVKEALYLVLEEYDRRNQR